MIVPVVGLLLALAAQVCGSRPVAAWHPPDQPEPPVPADLALEGA